MLLFQFLGPDLNGQMMTLVASTMARHSQDKGLDVSTSLHGNNFQRDSCSEKIDLLLHCGEQLAFLNLLWYRDYSRCPVSAWRRLLFRKTLIYVTSPISLVTTIAIFNALLKRTQAAKYTNSKTFLVGVLRTI